MSAFDFRPTLHSLTMYSNTPGYVVGRGRRLLHLLDLATSHGLQIIS